MPFSTKYDFHLTEKSPKKNYWKQITKNTSTNFVGTLLLPPPNITGNLHLGHAFESVIQDFLVRFSYLNQEPIYWIAGIDHAGISTQGKIEKLQLPELNTDEKKRNYTFQVWYPQTRQNFYQQWEKLGLLIDYERASFTLDPIIQKQVREAFVKLYQSGLIYRGKRLVNWDPQLKSVISDIEVEHRPSKSKLYYLKYPLSTSIKKQTNQGENLPKVVRAVIQNKKGEILLVRDKKWGWNFPGGKIEKGETPELAAKREIFEETNLVAENLENVAEEVVFYANQYWKVYFFYIKSYSGEIQIPKEEEEKILAVKFVDYNSLEVKEGCGLYRSIFTNFDEYLKPLNSAKNDYLLVATSRPETILADVALFINPYDERFKKYLGQSIRHPFTGKIIPILADESIKIDFGSGVLKCTPGHDFIDYELGKKYQLPIISCVNEKGILNESADQWQGREISSIREEFVAKLVEKKICVKIKEYETNLTYSSKSGVIIEPLLSQQWFLDLPTLIKEVEKKQPNFLTKIDFTTRQFRKVLENWCSRAHEWCISRQLWWGHQIPAWYHKKTGEIYVGATPPLQEAEWETEKDVLDTWFSSGLWPLIVLAKEGEKFPSPPPNCYPITTLITGYDILFFWVLKMILLGTYFTGKVPFQQVLLHGLIRDEDGKKMSKSLGNGVEPDELITKYGCDSLRLFLLENNVWGSDLIYNENKVVGSWRFCQKLWSIGNLISSKISDTELRRIQKKELKKSDLVNNWILNELAICQKDYFNHIEKKEINFATAKLIKFTREKLSNEYLELIKISPWDTSTKNTFLFVYQQLLIMLHPAIPFITEHIYQEITQQEILNRKIERIDIKTENNNFWQVDCLLLLISNIRNFQQKSKVSEFYLELVPEWKNKLNSSFNFNQYLEPLTKSKVSILEKEKKDEFSSFLDLQPFGILWYREKIDKKELEEQLKFYEKEYQRSNQLLTNNNFIKKAPPQLIAEERKKIIYYQEQKKKIQTELEKFTKH